MFGWGEDLKFFRVARNPPGNGKKGERDRRGPEVGRRNSHWEGGRPGKEREGCEGGSPVGTRSSRSVMKGCKDGSTAKEEPRHGDSHTMHCKLR